MVHIEVAPFEKLLSHFRFLVTLRSQEGKYHSLILFRLSSSADNHTTEEDTDVSDNRQLYAMEAQCPHLGADISHAEIEECDNSMILVCPWHRYDFDLRTGHSETGLKACTYDVQLKSDDAGVENVWLETPEEFADPPPPPPDMTKLRIHEIDNRSQDIVEEVVPPDNPPKTLMEWAVLILGTANPTLKVQRTKHAVNLYRTGQLKSIGHRSAKAPPPPEVPPREELYARNTVAPGRIGKRKNRPVMLHALANIEQWAYVSESIF
ncbi:hypothetical protein NLI96_g11622 [Meripilus lineatus]|uniref:Rieske domain-containing protein n=1 Tax=Meripilus lineatus TaxID=2056292 RepID=A0AAD5URI5_9APHY|nr:hypothetical protein NLI96_g11622 [Physisporinus lineatus]